MSAQTAAPSASYRLPTREEIASHLETLNRAASSGLLILLLGGRCYQVERVEPAGAELVACNAFLVDAPVKSWAVATENLAAFADSKTGRSIPRAWEGGAL